MITVSQKICQSFLETFYQIWTYIQNMQNFNLHLQLNQSTDRNESECKTLLTIYANCLLLNFCNISNTKHFAYTLFHFLHTINWILSYLKHIYKFQIFTSMSERLLRDRSGCTTICMRYR